ncbi:MAG: formimidoyltetrahydrofolate cyclodeaminase [Acholeplasmatales bacterium]|nr:MAG: formimidoyltetrahydrofolate cyclodeaminase [Acholeplasmatales bacterium]
MFEECDCMKLVDMSVREFVYEVDSAKPAPGGGSVSAVAAALGAGLLRMVGHLTLPKKKFQTLDEAVQSELISAHEALKTLEVRLLDLVDRDTDAFNAIMESFRMPKETEAEKIKRKKAIDRATLGAIEVPEAIAKIALEALEKAHWIVQYGNKNAISDVGVAVLMLYAGLEGACLNVMINLSGMEDTAHQNALKAQVETLLAGGQTARDTVLAAVRQALL